MMRKAVFLFQAHRTELYPHAIIYGLYSTIPCMWVDGKETILLEVEQTTWDNMVKRRKTCASEIAVHKIHTFLTTNKKRSEEEEC